MRFIATMIAGLGIGAMTAAFYVLLMAVTGTVYGWGHVAGVISATMCTSYMINILTGDEDE